MHELAAQLVAAPVREVQDPVRVSAVQRAVGVDRLWFDPDAEPHAEFVDVPGNGDQSLLGSV